MGNSNKTSLSREVEDPTPVIQDLWFPYYTKKLEVDIISRTELA